MSEPNLSAAPPKEPGGRSFLIAALVMIALIAGLLIWKSNSSEPEAAAPEPPPKAAAPPRPVLDPLPPPPVDDIPPPPAPEPAKAEPEKPARRRNTGCDGACTGKETPELLSALRAKGGQARSCYERALTHNSSLQGNLVISVRIGPGGEACSASASSDTLGEPSVTNCIVQRFRTGKFPKPSGGCVDVAVPIKLVPGR